MLGRQGLFEGTDYRGMKVVADLSPIPHSPWFMVAKVDTDEILAQARDRGATVAFFVALFILLAASATAYAYRHRQARLYRHLYRSERARNAEREEFRATLYSIGDAVITTDTEGRVRRMNPVGERLTGWIESEARGSVIDDVFHVVDEVTRGRPENAVRRALREGNVLGLANHTLLIAKDATEYPIMVSGSPIRDDDGKVTGVVLVFRDQTQARAAQQALQRSEELFRLAFENANIGVCLMDTQGRFLKVNHQMCEMLGYGRSELEGMNVNDITHVDDRELSQRFLERSCSGKIKRDEYEKRYVHKQGHVVWGKVSSSLVEDEQGNPFYFICHVRNITDRKMAEEALRESEERFSKSFRNNPAWLAIVHMGTNRVLEVNDAWTRLSGYTREEAIGRTTVELGIYDAEAYRGIMEEAQAKGSIRNVEVTIRTRTGENRVLLVSREVIRISGEDYLLAMGLDITDRKRAEDALRASEEKFAKAFQNSPDPIIMTRLSDGSIVDVNERFVRLSGYRRDEALGRTSIELDFWSIAADRDLYVAALREKGRVIDVETEFRIKSGEIRSYLVSGECIELQGEPHILGILHDITERKRAAQALQESEERFRVLADGAFEGVVITRDSLILDSNEVFCRMSGYALEELVGMSLRDIIAPEFLDIAMRHVLSGSEDAYGSAVIRKDGPVIPVQVKGKAIPYEGGVARIASIRDITAARVAEETQRRLATAIEQSAEAVLITDTEGIIRYVNPAVERVTGFSRDELLGRTPRVFRSGEHDTAFYHQLWDTIKGGNIWTGRFVNKRKDGSFFHEDATISPVRNAADEITNFVAVKRDITEHLELSKQLFQAQKMEAVGTLAGGIAHDFNNLLQIVLGYSELILSDEDLAACHRDDLGRINKAARNGADLVRRLLTLSRKTEGKPQPLNLNTRIEQLRQMLSRTLPKMIEIELVTADDLAAINADPTQMEQLLMNLAVNARDAMPDGGRLTIRTENVTLGECSGKTHIGAEPGRYVLISVSDTGCGMDSETLEHIFEPFFTTKRPCEGTGLGLAMVYGIVKQHGGHIMCYSEPAQGTTFNMCFPALYSDEELQEVERSRLPRGGSETILLVDDEQMIRDLGSRILKKAGYRVIAASNGREALDVYQTRKDEISLVVLDLIMPEMGGKQCLEALLSLNELVKVVIASGYSADGASKEAISSGARGFVNKPYDIRQVLDVVRAVLDEKEGPSKT